MLTINKILCPVDFSSQTDLVLGYTAELARNSGAAITLIYVQPLHYAYGYGVYDMALNMMEETKAEALKMLDERKHQLEQDLEGVKIDTKIEMGDAAEVILETEKALNPDLIVMGSHGRKGISRLLMGSVAEVVFRHATCPVLLVKK